MESVQFFLKILFYIFFQKIFINNRDLTPSSTRRAIKTSLRKSMHQNTEKNEENKLFLTLNS